jgi:two-component system sensor histidine kinase PilS (NtrC family)
MQDTRRLYWMALARGVLCAFAFVIVALNVEPALSPETALPFAVIVAAFAANLLSLAAAALGVPARAVAAVTIHLDVLLISALVYATGGANSEFLLLYFGPILAAAVTFSRTGTLLIASFSTMGLFACAAAYGFAGPRPPLVSDVWLAKQVSSLPVLAGVLAMQAAALHVVALLASTLAHRLRRAAIEVRQILENMTDGVITVEKGGAVVFANARSRALLGADPREPLVGQDIQSAMPEAVVRLFETVIATARAEMIDVDLGPSRVPAQVVVLPLADPSGGVRGANVIVHDISERLKLIDAQRRADRLEATATTVASIAHEIRNPIAAIRGSAQELKSVLRLAGPEAPLLDLVIRESDRLNRVLTEFLKFSRMPKPQVADCDLSLIVREVADSVRASGNGRALDLKADCGKKTFIKADAEGLRQVFLNIGLNALDATGGAGPIEFSVSADAAGAAIAVSDGGPGFDDASRERIFEPFFTTKTTGTGLGLSIAKRIVEDHGGTIAADRKDGRTCFRVFIPRVTAPPACDIIRTGDTTTVRFAY